jgi:hypothetical protein
MIAPLVVHPDQGSAAPPADAPRPAAAAETPLTAAPAAAHSGGAHQPQEVVPHRPEPYLPRRRPDYPEPGTVPAASAPTAPGPLGLGRVAAPTHGSAAVHPATSPLIERDPSVNRSLLLRLIAGVRGL